MFEYVIKVTNKRSKHCGIKAMLVLLILSVYCTLYDNISLSEVKFASPHSNMRLKLRKFGENLFFSGELRLVALIFL